MGTDLVTSPSIKQHILVVAICMIICWNYWIPTFLYSSPAMFYGSGSADFNIFYVAGSSWLGHNNPYLNTYPSQFVYPPTSLPFYGLFALFDPDSAGLLWMATYFAVFAAAFLALAFTLRREVRSLYLWILPLLFFTSFPLLVLMELGQSDLLVASLSVLGLVSMKLNRRYLSALLLSLAVLMKVTPAVLLIYFVLYRRDMKYLASFLLSTLGIVGVSLLVVPVQWYWYYIVKVAPTLSEVSSQAMNQSVVRYASLAGMSKISPVISILGFGLLAVFALFVNSKRIRRFGISGILLDDAMFLMNVLVMLLLGPRSWPATYVWVLLPVALFLSGLIGENVRARFLALVGVAVILLNMTLVQLFLVSRSEIMELPLAMIGNLILTLSLVLLYLHPNAALEQPARPVSA